MKKLLYFIILVVSLTLAFTQGKPCCKNKSGKGKISCKFNKANIEINNNDIIADEKAKTSEKSNVTCDRNDKLNLSDQNECRGCKNAPWWKFWVKKNNCCNNRKT